MGNQAMADRSKRRHVVPPRKTGNGTSRGKSVHGQALSVIQSIGPKSCCCGTSLGNGKDRWRKQLDTVGRIYTTEPVRKSRNHRSWPQPKRTPGACVALASNWKALLLSYGVISGSKAMRR